MVIVMGREDEFAPLTIGYDNGNGKDLPVLTVFKRKPDGSYILIKNFIGSDATSLYETLTKKEVN